MEVIAKKSKEMQNKALVYCLIALFLAVVLLVVEIVCWTKIGWRWTDVLCLLLLICDIGYSVYEGIEYFKMASVPEDVITYEEEKVCFSGELVCLPSEIENLSYSISEESGNKDWGMLSFCVDGNDYTCPLIADINTVFDRLVELGAKAAIIETVTEETVEESEEKTE